MGISGLVKSFIGNPGGHGAVTDDRNHLGIFIFYIFGTGDAKAGGYGGAAVTGCKRIKSTLAAAGKSGNSVKLAQGMKSIASTGKQFVGIGLMPDIPDDFIPGGIKNIMNRNCQFDSPQTGGQMTAGLGYHIDNNFANFFCQFWKIIA